MQGFVVYQDITDNVGWLAKDLNREWVLATDEEDAEIFPTWLDAAAAAYESYTEFETPEDFAEEVLSRAVQIRVKR